MVDVEMELEEGPAPWERQPWDTQKSYQVFSNFFLTQPIPRKVSVAYRNYMASLGREQRTSYRGRTGQAPPHMLLWARGQNRLGEPIPGAMTWEARANAYDDYIAELARQQWIQKQLEVREKEWSVGTKLMERALAMLETPLFRQIESEEDGSITIEPAAWKEADIARSLDIASKLLRKAAQMETERVTVDWRRELEKAGVDAGDVFENLVQEIARGLSGRPG